MSRRKFGCDVHNAYFAYRPHNLHHLSKDPSFLTNEKKRDSRRDFLLTPNVLCQLVPLMPSRFTFYFQARCLEAVVLIDGLGIAVE